VVRSFRYEDSLSPVLTSEVRVIIYENGATPSKSLARSTSSLGALAMGLEGTDWELDFKQFSFYHIMQVLRIYDFSTFSSSPAFPPCSCPLAFRH